MIRLLTILVSILNVFGCCSTESSKISSNEEPENKVIVISDRNNGSRIEVAIDRHQAKKLGLDANDVANVVKRYFKENPDTANNPLVIEKEGKTIRIARVASIALIDEDDLVYIAVWFEDKIEVSTMIMNILEKNEINVSISGKTVNSAKVKRDQAQIAISCLKEAQELRGRNVRIGYNCWRPPQKVEGSVVEVNTKSKTALISVGETEEVQGGSEFTVYRCKLRKYVGELTVIRMEPSRLQCRILKEDYWNGPIQAGDNVTGYIWYD